MQPASTSATSEELGPGAVLGKYRVNARLGEGAMGVVYAAVHERLGRPVAIKVLRRELSENTEFSQAPSPPVAETAQGAARHPPVIPVWL